jgi:hypothetical protein
MTDEQIKEQLSNRYVGILAVNRGFTITKPDIDEGVDYIVQRSYRYNSQNGSNRHVSDGKFIEIQLKATTEDQIVDEADQIKYDLEVKNYNDMIQRQGGITPLILILFILPTDRNSWVELDSSELRIRRLAYWYQPPTGELPTTNTATKRIIIPKINALDLDCFNTLHAQFYP